ncbi:MAG TPA: DUF4845 domain-containing protein [Steroidobacteraceae bacterium]|jgi:hypothetical protein|nr:DUF4845 domain-containing protein [Steroidobacteraceae bacterium]
MRRHERGVTFLGWVIILLPIALVVYAGIRLTPVYLEYMKVARTLEQVRDELKGDQPDVTSIRNAIEKRFDIEDVNVMTVRDADKLKITRQGSGWQVEAVYQATAPYISNVSLVVNFDKVVQID